MHQSRPATEVIRKHLDIAALAILMAVIAALAVSFVTASPTKAQRSAEVSHAVQSRPPSAYDLPHTILPKAVGPGYYTPPVTINTTCATDDTHPLLSWFYSLPQGSPQLPTIVRFSSHACYLVNGELYLRGFRSLYIDGEGATFKQDTPRTCPEHGNYCMGGGSVTETDPTNNPATAPYCGSTAYKNDWSSEDLNVDTMWWFEGGCDITLTDLTIDGTNNGAPGGPRMQDSFVGFAGTQRALVDDVTMSGPYGDYVDAAQLHEAAPLTSEATNVTVTQSSFRGAGRQGFGIIGASRVAITDNHIYGAAATVFDIEIDNPEPIGSHEQQDDIDISRNVIVGFNFSYLLSAQTVAEVNRLAFDDNSLIDGAQLRIVIAPWSKSTDIQIAGNTAQQPSTQPFADVVLKEQHGATISGVVVRDNTVPIYEYSHTIGQPFVSFDSANDWVADNTLRPVEYLGLRYYAGSISVRTSDSPGVACGDRTSAGARLDPACRTALPAITAPAPPELPEN
jgi:hypothetical protein